MRFNKFLRYFLKIIFTYKMMLIVIKIIIKHTINPKIMRISC
jgi:hypothetical protein